MRRVHLFMALVMAGRVLTFPLWLLLMLVCFLAQAVTDLFRWTCENVVEFWEQTTRHFTEHAHLWREISRPGYSYRQWLLEAVERDTLWTFLKGVFWASCGWRR